MNKKNNTLQPVFIIGAGRSGTKFLRDILNSSDEVVVIPYDVGYVWRYGNEKLKHDQLTPDLLNNDIIKYIKTTLPKLTKNYPNKESAKIFIEKSVPNTLRPAFIKSIYPDAKFIHLIRDGRAVSESAIRLWGEKPAKKYLINKIKYFPLKSYKYALNYLYNLIKNKIIPNHHIQTWGPRYEGIQEDVKTVPLEVICARQWKKCIEVSLSQFKNFESENLLEVSYENLMRDSSSIIAICKYLNINDLDKVKQNYEKRVNRSHSEKWRKSLTEDQLKLINSEILELNNKLGYK